MIVSTSMLLSAVDVAMVSTRALQSPDCETLCERGWLRGDAKATTRVHDSPSCCSRSTIRCNRLTNFIEFIFVCVVSCIVRMDALRLVLYQLRLANWELLALFVRLVFDLLRVKRDFAAVSCSNFKRAPYPGSIIKSSYRLNVNFLIRAFFFRATTWMDG